MLQKAGACQLTVCPCQYLPAPSLASAPPVTGAVAPSAVRFAAIQRLRCSAPSVLDPTFDMQLRRGSVRSFPGKAGKNGGSRSARKQACAGKLWGRLPLQTTSMENSKSELCFYEGCAE